MFKRILVPLDGSELAERALEPALVLARRAEAELLLVHVPERVRMPVSDLAGHNPYWPQMAMDELHYEGRDYLNRFQYDVSYRDVALRTLLLDGDVRDVILETAVSEQVDLIIMSTHGRTGLRRLVLGSVAESVLRMTPCPVLVLRNRIDFSRMMIALDGSELAELVLEPAMALAQMFDMPMVLARVEDEMNGHDSRHLYAVNQMEPGLGEQVRRTYEELAEKYLQKLIAQRNETMPAVQCVVARSDDPAQALLKLADLNKCDLVAVTTHGRTGFSRLVYGSVTEHLLRHIEGGMLVVRNHPKLSH
jgi:nucleotide-binding universal stress UspA family protein